MEYLQNPSIAESSASVGLLVKALKLSRKSDDLVVNSLHEAITWCRTHYGKKEQGWQWGKVHSAVFEPASAPKFYLYDTLWARGPSPLGGGEDSLLRTHYLADNAIFDRTALWHTHSVGSSLR